MSEKQHCLYWNKSIYFNNNRHNSSITVTPTDTDTLPISLSTTPTVVSLCGRPIHHRGSNPSNRPLGIKTLPVSISFSTSSFSSVSPSPSSSFSLTAMTFSLQPSFSTSKLFCVIKDTLTAATNKSISARYGPRR